MARSVSRARMLMLAVAVALLALEPRAVRAQMDAPEDVVPATGDADDHADDGADHVTMCTLGDLDQCLELAEGLETEELHWMCSEAKDGESLLDMLETGRCDVLTDLDAGEAWEAYNKYQMDAILAHERDGAGSTLSYFAVAVVPAAACEGDSPVSMTSLKGSRSCHTGYRRTSGWTIPLGSVINLETGEGGDGIEFRSGANGTEGVQTDADIMSAYFPTMCAPGYSGDEEQTKEDLCANCAGDCSSSQDAEPYIGYDGALRCLMEDAGDVAFVKHVTPIDYASDGEDAQDWSTMAAADMRIVCPSGGCAEVADYEGCNWAKVPSHMVVAKSGAPIDGIKQAMMAAADAGGLEAYSSDGGLFKKGITGFVPIDQPLPEYLGRLNDVYSSLNSLGLVS